jgi:hypothetical protein
VICVDLSDWSTTDGILIPGYTAAIGGDGTGMAWISIPQEMAETGGPLGGSTHGFQRFDIDACAAEGDVIPTNLQPYSLTFY